MKLKERKLWLVISIIVVLIVTVPTWRKLYYRCEDVDIKTGRIRCTRYLLYCKISEKIEDSLLTETIGEFADDVQSDWRRVNKFYPGMHYSPHYAYHGAFSQIHKVDIIWQSFPFSDEARRHMARTILEKWQSNGSYFPVGTYINDVSSAVQQKAGLDPEAIISVADLASIQDE